MKIRKHKKLRRNNPNLLPRKRSRARKRGKNCEEKSLKIFKFLFSSSAAMNRDRRVNDKVLRYLFLDLEINRLIDDQVLMRRSLI